VSTPSFSVGRYFLLAFAWSWAFWTPGVLALRDVLPGPQEPYLSAGALGILGPALAASYGAFRENGKPGLRALWHKLVEFRGHIGLYLVGLVGPALCLSLILGLLRLAGRDAPIHHFPGAPGLVVGLVVATLEEIGWRGFAFPRLAEKFGALGASLLLGVAWYLWHLPMFELSGVPQELALVFVLYFVGGSLFMTALYKKSGGSLPLMVLVHWGAHLNNSHRALPSDSLPLVVHAVVFAAFGLLSFRLVFGDFRAQSLARLAEKR
jgi:uncharacterized protein